MFIYLIRRILYAIPILIGVCFVTFFLFFMVNSPDDIARMQLGQKYVTPAQIDSWKKVHGYDQPLFYNPHASGMQYFTQTLFYKKTLKLFALDFGRSDSGRNIGQDISERMWPSLTIAIPTLILGILVEVTLALLLVFFRNTYLDLSGMFLCVILMSISGMFYIIAGQYFFSKLLRLVPISGYAPGLSALRFVLLPILIGIVSGIGAGIRWNRSIFLEEINKDYIRTARAKGLSEIKILFKHMLANGMIPILTSVVAIIPLLFMGSLILESFFGIPGLGSYVIDAIGQQDFAIVHVMIFLGTVLYIFGLVLTDIAYTIVDPRVRLE
ncbi:MAG: ABC transporter permease [Gammaproteobacteria bacterium]